MPTGFFYGITTNPILAERVGLFYSTINWRSKMTIADELISDDLTIEALTKFNMAASKVKI